MPGTVHLIIAMLAVVAVTPVHAEEPPKSSMCLSNRDIRAKDISAEHGYFARTPQGWWRNNGPACSAFGPNRAIITRSNQDRQCRGDLAVMFDPVSRIEYGACLLGNWQRVDAPPKD